VRNFLENIHIATVNGLEKTINQDSGAQPMKENGQENRV